MWTPLGLALAGLLAAGVAMALLWAVQLRTRNAGLVDVGWALSVGALAVLASALSDGWSGRRLAIAVVMAIWGGRLGLYLLRDRVIGKPEDGRYAELRRLWGATSEVRLFWFFQEQALAAVFFSLPALIASANARPHFAPLEVASLLLWLVAFGGELIADRQFGTLQDGSGQSRAAPAVPGCGATRVTRTTSSNG